MPIRSIPVRGRKLESTSLQFLEDTIGVIFLGYLLQLWQAFPVAVLLEHLLPGMPIIQERKWYVQPLLLCRCIKLGQKCRRKIVHRRVVRAVVPGRGDENR